MEPAEALPALTPHRSAEVLAYSIVSLFFSATACACCGCYILVGVPLAVAALVIAERELSGMRAGAVDPSGRGSIVAGKVLAIVSLCLAALQMLAFAGGLVFALFAEAGG